MTPEAMANTMVKLTFEQQMASWALQGWEPSAGGLAKRVEPALYVVVYPFHRIWAYRRKLPKEVNGPIPSDVGLLLQMIAQYERDTADDNPS